MNNKVWLEAGTYPVVLGYRSSEAGVSKNMVSASQVVATDDAVLYVAAHGSARGMKVNAEGGVRCATDVAKSITCVLTERFKKSAEGERQVRWMDEEGMTKGSKKLGAAIMKNTAPFGDKGRFDKIVLVSCNTGSKPRNSSGVSEMFAQQLATILNVTIIAPERRVNVSHDGAHPLVRKCNKNIEMGYLPRGKGWRVFTPDGKGYSPYDGDSLPGWV